MKYILSFTLCSLLSFSAFAKPKGRTSASIDNSKCQMAAKEVAKKTLQKEDSGSGLNEDVPLQFLALNKGGVYVVSGWIQRVFDWQVIIVFNENCEVQSATLN